jgi:CBS domain-containing protein
MSSDNLHLGASLLEAAIDHHPLVVSPDAPLTEVVVLMSQTRGVICSWPAEISPELPQEIRASCVLVMQSEALLGIVTERDIVRMTAAGLRLEGTRVAEVMAHPVITLAEKDFCDIFAALFLFRRYRIRHLVIVDEQHRMIGTVSPASIRRVLQPTNLLKLRRVGEVMAKQVIHAPRSTPVISLAQQMAEHRVSCIVIIDDTGIPADEQVRVPVGIVTERDVVQFQALGLNLVNTEAETVMSCPLFLASPADSLWSVHQEMERRRVQRLVVSWNWGLGLGIVTQTSLLRVFDPIEMHGVIETLQHSLEAQGVAAAQRFDLPEQNATASPLTADGGGVGSATPLAAPSAARDESIAGPLSNLELSHRLHRLQAGLQRLADQPDLAADRRQADLTAAIVDLQSLLRCLPASASERSAGQSQPLSF